MRVLCRVFASRGVRKVVAAAMLLLPACVSAGASVTATIAVGGSAQAGDGSSIVVAFNGFQETVRYDSTSTVNSVASGFAAMFSRDYLSAGLCASASGGTISFKLKTGTFGAVTITDSNVSFGLTATGFGVMPPATAATPVFSVPGGTYTSAQMVGITEATTGATVYYTTDGTTPSSSSTPYSGPIAVGASETLQAIAIANGYGNSPVASAAYVIHLSTGLTALPATVNFGSLTTKFLSSAQTVTLTNQQSTSVLISGITVSGGNAEDFLVLSYAKSCRQPLLAGTSCTVSVEFQPQASGTRSTSLTIASNAANPMLTVALSGQGVAPAAGPATVSVSSLSFTEFGVAQNVTLSNYGNGPLTINGINFGSNTYYSETDNCGTSLPAQSICTIAVSAGQGAVATATMTVVDDASAGPQTVGLAYTSGGVGAPEAYVFGGWSVGATGTIQVSFSLPQKNDVASFNISGPNASDFTVVPYPECGSGEGILCNPTVTFAPSGLGQRSAMLNIGHNGALVGSVPMSGTGLPAGAGFMIAQEPLSSTLPISSYDFMTGTVGQSASTRNLVLQNTGTVAINLGVPQITGANPGAFSAVAGCTSLAVGANCSITFSSAPYQVGPLSATVTIVDTTGAVSQSFALTNYGEASPPTASPSTISFSSTQVGTRSAAVPVSITAYQGAGVTLLQSYLGAFVVTGNPSCPSTPCTIMIAFAPTATGNSYGGLYFTDTVYYQEGGMNLSGYASAAPPPAGTVGLSPTSLTFPLRSVGTTSIAQTVTLMNTATGSAVLSIGGISLVGANQGDYVLTNGCGSALAAGANCSFTISFAPKAVGTRTASVQVVTNATSSPDTVLLSGTAQ